MVYILSKDGVPLMPTKRHGKVRHLLKSKKAKVVKTRPFFTIQLLYETKNYTQNVQLNIDSGYTYVGASVQTKKDELLSCEVTLLEGMKDRIKEKSKYRRTRRNKLRYRKCRFENRKKTKGWLAPSLQHKYESHIKIIDMIKNILPVKKTVVEVAAFDTQKLKNPDIDGVQYQEGPQKDFFNLREYILHRDGHKCTHPDCKNKDKNPILQLHHFLYWKGSTTDNPNELATLCNKCHTPRNHDKKGKLWGWQPKIHKGFKEAAYMTTIRWKLVNNLNCKHTYGYLTKSRRIELKLPKSHANDAFVMENNIGTQNRCETVYLKQIRRNNRSLTKFYDAKYIDLRTGEKATGKELFSGRTTRNKVKNGENLHKYRAQKVSKGRVSTKTQRYNIRPNDIVLYENQKYTVKGMQNKGTYIKLDGLKKPVKIDKVKHLYYAKQFILVS